ncbi:hypothetical protein JL720_1815 [Aureococcus anophagefferens]|nr:hypothetical protein JL720_1815 [Aureococcus anophagefferens]
MADRSKIPKKKDKLAGTTSIKPPGDAMHAAQAKNRKPEQQGAFSSGSSPAKASGGWLKPIASTGTKPKDGGGPRTTAADKRKAQETHRPGSAKAEKKPRAAPKPAAAPLKFTNVSAAETKPKAPKAPKPAKNYPNFDDDDDAPPASPGKPSKREAAELAKLLAGDDSDDDDLLGAAKPPKSSADVLAELRGDSDDDDDLLGDTKPEKSNADVLAELGDDSDGDDVLGETPPAAAASDSESEEDTQFVEALMSKQKKKVEKKRNASPPPKKKPAAKKKPAVNPFNFDSDGDDDATPAAAPEPLLDAAADDDDDDDLFASPAASSPLRSRTPAPRRRRRIAVRARKKKAGGDASAASSPRPSAKKSRSGARKPKAAASDDDDDDYEEASPRSPRKKAARKDGKRKSGGAGAPAKKKPKAPSSSSGSDSEEPLDDFFWKERDGEKVTGTRRMAAVAAPSRECPHAAVAPAALASIEKYAVPSLALVWVKVGRSFYYDGRKQSGDQRPGYVLPAAELEDLGIPKPVGGEHMRVVRLFDDHAFVPWDGPKAVRASETRDFGSGRSSNYWEKGKVRTLEKDCAPVDGGTSGELEEYGDADRAYDAVRAHLLDAALGAGADRARAAELVDLLVDADLFSSSLAAKVLDDAAGLPLSALQAALDDPPAALDADIVAACAKSLGDVVDGTLVARIQCAERAGRPQQ